MKKLLIAISIIFLTLNCYGREISKILSYYTSARSYNEIKEILTLEYGEGKETENGNIIFNTKDITYMEKDVMRIGITPEIDKRTGLMISFYGLDYTDWYEVLYGTIYFNYLYPNYGKEGTLIFTNIDDVLSEKENTVDYHHKF